MTHQAADRRVIEDELLVGLPEDTGRQLRPHPARRDRVHQPELFGLGSRRDRGRCRASGRRHDGRGKCVCHDGRRHGIDQRDPLFRDEQGAELPEQTEQDREIIPHFIIVGYPELTDELINKHILTMAHSHITRNNQNL